MISTEFKQNVASGDLDTVRSALIDYLIIDRTFKSFDESLEYAKNCMDIIEPYNNEPPFAEEPWDTNYLNQQKVALMMNFSIERIRHIKSVISAVMPEQTIIPRSDEGKSSPTNSRTGSKTGRSVVSETTLPKPESPRTTTNRTIPNKQGTPRPSSHSSDQTRNTSTKKTGARVVRETVSSPKRSEEKEKSDTDVLGTALIIGGIAVAAVGLATVEPIVVGTGVVIAGAGVGVKAKNRR